MAALAYRDTTAENRSFWKNEMAKALREIQDTYDEKLDHMKREMETYYNLKVRRHWDQEMRSKIAQCQKAKPLAASIQF